MFWYERAEEAVSIAKYYAKRGQYAMVNSAHVLAGLHCADCINPFGGVLHDLGIYSNKVLESIERRNLQKDCNLSQDKDLPWTKKAVQITELAKKVAEENRCLGIETGHLLLAICNIAIMETKKTNGECVLDKDISLAGEIIKEFGIDVENIMTKVLEIFNDRESRFQKANPYRKNM